MKNLFRGYPLGTCFGLADWQTQMSLSVFISHITSLPLADLIWRTYSSVGYMVSCCLCTIMLAASPYNCRLTACSAHASLYISFSAGLSQICTYADSSNCLQQLGQQLASSLAQCCLSSWNLAGTAAGHASDMRCQQEVHMRVSQAGIYHTCCRRLLLLSSWSMVHLELVMYWRST